MKELFGLKPQDVLVLLKLIIVFPNKERILFQADIARELGMSAAEINNSLARLKGSRLINSENKPNRQAAVEFIISGVKYVYPSTPGPITRGMPTAHSAPPLNQKFKAVQNDIYVWPDPQGEISGQAILPLYKAVPTAAKNDYKLYEMLALIDALRVGRAREVEAAKEDLKQRLKGKA